MSEREADGWQRVEERSVGLSLQLLHFDRTQLSSIPRLVFLSSRSILGFRVLQFCQLFIRQDAFIPLSTEINGKEQY